MPEPFATPTLEVRPHPGAPAPGNLGHTASAHPETPLIPPATRIAAALTLLILAPFMGEYLLGNVPVQELWALPLLALLYGGGALLVREVAVRWGLDGIGVVLLGAAYGLIEAGLVDQSLFSPSFEGMAFQEVTPIPVLGISAHAALGFVSGHAMFSIAVPIALTGLLFPTTRGRPLTGPMGLALVVAAYGAGCWLVFDHMLSTEGFMATPAQRLGAVAGVIVLIGAALRRGGFQGGSSWRPPAPLWVGVASFTACGVDMQFPETWIGVALMLTWLASVALIVPRFARHSGWTTRHTLALVAGSVLTFAWLGFVLASILAPGDVVRHLGNAGFALVAIALLVLAHGQVARSRDPSV